MALVALLAALVPRLVAAQSSELSYGASDPRCPTEDEVRAGLRDALRAAPVGELPPIVAAITIEAEAGGFVATVVLREEGYEDRRVLSDRDCDVLARAATLVVAVALVPELDVRAAEAPTVPPEAPMATPPPTALRGALWLAVHGSYGVLPGAALGVELGGSLAIDSLRVDLAVRGLPFVGAHFASAPMLGGDIAEIVSVVRARGVGIVDEHIELSVGGGLEAGAVLGTGLGISDPRSNAAPWVAVEAAARVAWTPLRDLALFLEIEALVPVVRPVFSVAGLGVLYRPEPIDGAVRIGVEVRTP